MEFRADLEFMKGHPFLDEVPPIRADDVANLNYSYRVVRFERMVRSAIAFTFAVPCLDDVFCMFLAGLEQAILPNMCATGVHHLQLAVDSSRPNTRHHEDGTPRFDIRSGPMCQPQRLLDEDVYILGIRARGLREQCLSSLLSVRGFPG